MRSLWRCWAVFKRFRRKFNHTYKIVWWVNAVRLPQRPQSSRLCQRANVSVCFNITLNFFLFFFFSLAFPALIHQLFVYVIVFSYSLGSSRPKYMLVCLVSNEFGHCIVKPIVGFLLKCKVNIEAKQFTPKLI